MNTILNQCMYRLMPLPCAWEKVKEREHSAYKQEWRKRGHSNLEVIMSSHSWLASNLDSVVHDPVCTHPNGLLEIKCLYNYHDSTPCQAAS